MDFSQPPPVPMPGGPPPNLSMPPPSMPPPNFHTPHVGFNQRPPFRPFMKPLPGNLSNMTLEDFDGKRLRKSVMRKTVDYNSSIIKALENRIWQRDFRDRRALQPDPIYTPDLMPPPSYPDNPINCVTSRFVKTATNKMRCPIFCMAWTPEGRRLVTGASSGEFTLWNGLTFNFETILQAHDSPVRTMVWSHNDSWMVTGDHAGYVKYWQSNMNNVKMFQAHKEALRGISFSPADTKFVTCSDDGTLRIWDFFRYQEERVLRGHGADVKCVHWHPQKSLIISGSKDNQQPIKLWDPKTGQSLATLHAHKSTVMDLKWNENGNWLITASRDHLLKLFDLRNLSQEVQTFRGHKKEASSVAWHPIHEGLFASGGSDGAVMFWHVGTDKELGAIEQAHDSIVWTLAWHPLGHILCSGSNDHTSKFWTRNRPGDPMRDKYNLNTLPQGIAGFDDIDVGDDLAVTLPGMGPEDKVEVSALIGDETTMIPGFDLDSDDLVNEEKPKSKKVPFSKPIPKNFQASWNTNDDTTGEMLSTMAENTPGAIPLEKLTPNAIVVYGKVIPVEPGSKLEKAISEGPEALQAFIDSGEIEELNDVMPPTMDGEEDFMNDDFDIDKKRLPPGLFDQDYRDMDIRGGPKQDSDMRGFQPGGPPGGFKGDMDFRQPPNQNFISDDFEDEDFRNNGPPRNKFPPPINQDYDEDYGEKYYEDEPQNNFKNWSPSGAPGPRPPGNFNNFRGGFNPPPFRGRGMPGPRGSFSPRARPPGNFGPPNGNFGPGGPRPPNNGNFGPPRPPNSSNFEPNNSKFGPPSGPNSNFESNNSKFGPPSGLNSNFEPNNSKFGPPSGPNSNYGRPSGPNSNFGPPSGPNSNFGPPSGPNSNFGPPSGPNSNFGPPSGPNSNFGPPSGQKSNFGPPSKPNSNFGPREDENWEEDNFAKDVFDDNSDYSGDPQDYGPPPPKASRGRGRGRGGTPPNRGGRGGPRGRARGGRGRGNRGKK